MVVNKELTSKLLVAFNVLFLLTGGAAVAIGIWMLFDPGLLDVFYGVYKFLHPSALLIGAGLLTFLATFCGIGGARKENKCVVRTYIVFICIILVVEFVAGGLAFSYRRTVNAEITNHTITIVREKYGSGDRELDYAVDLLQERFKCCGADGRSDYNGSNWSLHYNKVSSKTVPQSCCGDPVKCAKATEDAEVFTVGCRQKLYTLVQDHYLILFGLGVGVGCAQLIGLILAWALSFALD